MLAFQPVAPVAALDISLLQRSIGWYGDAMVALVLLVLQRLRRSSPYSAANEDFLRPVMQEFDPRLLDGTNMLGTFGRERQLHRRERMGKALLTA